MTAIFNIITKLYQLFTFFKKAKEVVNDVQEIKTVVTDVVTMVQEKITPTQETHVINEQIEYTKEEQTMYTPSNKCYELIKQFEGFSAKPYKCPAGIPTIGYGSTFYENGTKVKMTDAVITTERGTQLLANVVDKFSKEVTKLITVPINQNHFDALVDFAYNVGTANLASSTLLKKVNAKLFTEAGDQFLRWNKAGGVVLAGLTKRREAEKKLFLS